MNIPVTTVNMDASAVNALPLGLREMVYEELSEGDFFEISLAARYAQRPTRPS